MSHCKKDAQKVMTLARNALKIKEKAIILKNDKKCSIKINKGGIIKQEGPKGPGSLT